MTNVPEKNQRIKHGDDLKMWLMEMVAENIWPQLKGNQHRLPQWPDIPVIDLIWRAHSNLEVVKLLIDREGKDIAQVKKELVDGALYCLFALDNVEADNVDD